MNDDKKKCPLINFGECEGDKCSFSRVISRGSSANENDPDKITRCEVAALDIWNEKILKTFQDVLGSLYTICDSMGIDQIKRRLDTIEMYIKKNDDKFYRMMNKDKIKKGVTNKNIKRPIKKVKKKTKRK